MENTLALITYLTFNGNCEEAMNFYHAALGGKIEMSKFGDMPGHADDATKDLVMHANIRRGHLVLMASDTTPDRKVTFGDNFSVSVNCTSKSEVDEFFGKLKVGGTVTMPLEDTFWGAYFGMLTDKFGINWMFNYDTPKS